ncbi:hypothetical protein [Gilvibacter sediminis]|uniref:hypothetical protein n=1 Tax=Gilvibacter sediminis TaxID=379071 RepID=UPI002350D1B9|nr:hypothetical protein [Gilvibacter sediminis]MDC7998130.1 hypothetical protein [Gilvibacter sediminis]
MNKSYWTLITLLLIVFSSCKEQTETPTTTAKIEELPTERAIIRGFSVKDSSGVMVKDALQALQTVIYGDQGNELANLFYNRDGSIAWEDQYTYNEEGQKSGSRYFEKGELKITYKYDLDDQGRRVGFRAHDAATGVEMYRGFSKYENDGKTRIDGTAPGPNAVVQWNYEYQFDEQGEETGYVYIDANGNRFPSSYEVRSRDDQGRWTSRAVISDGVVKAIETRTFEKLDLQQ